MLQDIFTNIFLQADIKTACNLRILSKQTYHYFDQHLLSSKLGIPFVGNSFKEWLIVYHDNQAKQCKSTRNYEQCKQLASNHIEHGKKNQSDIYVTGVARHHLIYKLLGMKEPNYNTITFHTNSNIISFGKLLASKPVVSHPVNFTCTIDAFIYYMAIIMYNHNYDALTNKYNHHYFPFAGYYIS